MLRKKAVEIISPIPKTSTALILYTNLICKWNINHNQCTKLLLVGLCYTIERERERRRPRRRRERNAFRFPLLSVSILKWVQMVYGVRSIRWFHYSLFFRGSYFNIVLILGWIFCVRSEITPHIFRKKIVSIAIKWNVVWIRKLFPSAGFGST